MMEIYEKMPDNTVPNIEFDLNNDSDNGTNNVMYAAAIKCIFSKPKTIVGTFCLLLRKLDLKVIELVLWTTKSASNENMELDISMPWEDFSTKIPSIGPIDKESCEKLQNILREKLSKEIIDDIFINHESNMAAFSNEVKELFEKNLHYLIKLDLEFEPFNQERLKISGYEREETRSNANSDNISMSQIMAEQIDGSQSINCTAIVDPVNGIAASELKKGDIVEVILPINSTIGTLLSDYYAKLKKVPEYPVKNVILTDNGSYIIELEADGGITCIIKITSDLRLRGRKGYAYERSLSGRNLIIIVGICALAIIFGLIALIRMLIE